MLPTHGEIWLKTGHPGICRMGWSLGAGVAVIDETINYDWGTEQQIKCGCLVKLANDIYEYEERGLDLIYGKPRYARGSILWQPE
jgi:hypothetical protein